MYKAPFLPEKSTFAPASPSLVVQSVHVFPESAFGDPTSRKVCPGCTDTSQDVGESPKQWEFESLNAVSMQGTESCPRFWKQPSRKEPLLQSLHPLSQAQLMFI